MEIDDFEGRSEESLLALSSQTFAGNAYEPDGTCGVALAYHFNGTELAGQMYCASGHYDGDDEVYGGYNIGVDDTVRGRVERWPG